MSPTPTAVEPSACVESATWPGADPAVTVVVSTYSRSQFVPELLDRLAGQGAPDGGFEVVIVDNGSTDDTWAVLHAAIATTPLRLRAVRLESNAGPAAARNTAVAHGRGALLACTDDDCLPEPGWLTALVTPFTDPDVALVQGPTRPETGNTLEHAPWSRSITVDRASVLFETCNIAYRRAAFERAGGFPVGDALTDRSGGGRAFGEDAVLGARVAADGQRAFANDAVIRHRWLPGTYADALRAARQLRGFPVLAREFPLIAAATTGRVFLSRRTVAVDAGLAGVAGALVLRQPLLALAAVPWFVHCWRDARWKPGRPRVVRAAQVAGSDVVGFVSLVEGSVRARRVLL